METPPLLMALHDYVTGAAEIFSQLVFRGNCVGRFEQIEDGFFHCAFLLWGYVVQYASDDAVVCKKRDQVMMSPLRRSRCSVSCASVERMLSRLKMLRMFFFIGKNLLESFVHHSLFGYHNGELEVNFTVAGVIVILEVNSKSMGEPVKIKLKST